MKHKEGSVLKKGKKIRVMSVQFEKFKSFSSTQQKNLRVILRVFPSTGLKMYRGLEGSSGKNSIFEYSYFRNGQMVHKMVHAVTAYPSIWLKLSVLRVFVLKFDNPCRKNKRVSSTEMVQPTKSIRVLSTGRQQS